METSNSLKKEKELVSSVQGVQRAAPWVLLLGVIFIAVNMRAPLTSVGPLVELIRDHLQLSNTMAGMITTLPLLSFALFSPFVPKLAKRFGMETILIYRCYLFDDWNCDESLIWIYHHHLICRHGHSGVRDCRL